MQVKRLFSIAFLCVCVGVFLFVCFFWGTALLHFVYFFLSCVIKSNNNNNNNNNNNDIENLSKRKSS